MKRSAFARPAMPAPRSAPCPITVTPAGLVARLRAVKCKACRQPFTPVRAMQHACSLDCALVVGKAKREKEERATAKADRALTRERRAALKPRAAWLREAQAAFNGWVRARDAALGCVSCGRHHGGKWNAGHYLSIGARPELRFEPLNVHRQCEPCNTYLSGNLVLYRAELIRRVGIVVVEWLEGPRRAAKYTIDDMRALRDTYRAMLRQMQTEAIDAHEVCA